MNNFAMCENSECPLSWNCRRFNAPPDLDAQEYGDFAPDHNGNCEFYLPQDEKERSAGEIAAKNFFGKED